jgi:hypothetical protein
MKWIQDTYYSTEDISWEFAVLTTVNDGSPVVILEERMGMSVDCDGHGFIGCAFAKDRNTCSRVVSLTV